MSETKTGIRRRIPQEKLSSIIDVAKSALKLKETQFELEHLHSGNIKAVIDQIIREKVGCDDDTQYAFVIKLFEKHREIKERNDFSQNNNLSKFDLSSVKKKRRAFSPEPKGVYFGLSSKFFDKRNGQKRYVKLRKINLFMNPHKKQRPLSPVESLSNQKLQSVENNQDLQTVTRTCFQKLCSKYTHKYIKLDRTVEKECKPLKLSNQTQEF
mmetsp:Transcript_30754/g.35173  ORF Transcript_30754/g.35173 Transcript_30754/m.35173 type:complete len:212 (+) Transcript_30754:2-637(+)